MVQKNHTGSHKLYISIEEFHFSLTPIYIYTRNRIDDNTALNIEVNMIFFQNSINAKMGFLNIV